MPTITNRTTRSRFKSDSLGQAVPPTDYVLSILELLQRYRYLPSSYVHAFVGKSHWWLKTTLTRLFHEGYVARPDESWRSVNARCRPAICQITPKGEQFLMDHGRFHSVRKTSDPFRHGLMVSLVAASFELGVRENKDLRLITSEEILAHPKCPETTRHSARPFVLPVSRGWIEPDAPLFGIARAGVDGSKRFLFFFGFEADRNTEPLSPTRLDRSSIRRKCDGYLAFARAGAFKTRYGIPNCLFPFITVNEEHMHNIMRLVCELTGGAGSPQFLFKTFSDFASFESIVSPSGHMLTEPWQRAGHPPFHVVAALQGSA